MPASVLSWCAFQLIFISSLKFDLCPLNCDPMLDKAAEGSGNSFTKRTYTQKFSQSSQQHSTKLKSMHIKREEKKETKENIDKNSAETERNSESVFCVFFLLSIFYFWGKICGILQNGYTHGQIELRVFVVLM